ncbi:MAG: pantoate--beta-alanine ligase [Chloroflexota bacterium]
MKTVETISEIHQARKQLSGSVGLVPTMGFWHEGHLSLVRAAKAACDHVIVSIFVNPTQFAPNEDLDNYPRDLSKDLGMLEQAGVDLVWLPTSEIMYPSGYQTWVEVTELTQPLEGRMRPGHFRGVTTIVNKLFNGTSPDKAFFGRKDAQQVAVIMQMTRDLNLPVEIIDVPISREEDGLARSSRNVYLSTEQRKVAVVLNQALLAAEKSFESGERSGDILRTIMQALINAEPLAKLEYVSCADRVTMQELEEIKTGALLSMAVFFGKIRLIDNWILQD